MVGFLERLFGRDGNNKEGSGKVAKDRLQLVLVKDRINLPSEKIKQMENEIIQVISKYVSVDMENVDFNLSNRDRTGLLIAEIPFIAVAEDEEETAAAAEDDIPTVPRDEDEDDDTVPTAKPEPDTPTPPPRTPLSDGNDPTVHDDDNTSPTVADDDD